MGKDWDKICAELSSGPESDEEDLPNIKSVKKNSTKLMHLASQLLLDVPEKHEDAQRKAQAAGSGVIPMKTAETFKFLGVEIAKRTGSSFPVSRPESGPGGASRHPSSHTARLSSES
jgi:hypothetical protein